MDVALKVLYSNIDYELIKKETSIQRKVCHKNILPLYGVSHFQKDKQTQYILVLELADYSLDIVTQTNTKRYLHSTSLPHRLSNEQKKQVLIEIAQGIAWMHTFGFIHRDLKTNNILIKNEHPLIADFGLSRELQNKNSIFMTTVGTPLTYEFDWNGTKGRAGDRESRGSVQHGRCL